MKTSEQINEIASAMVKAQAAMKPAIKDANNPAFKSKYADLTAVWDACRGPLTSAGVTVWQDVEATADGIAVTTRLAHTSGQWVEFGPLVVPLSKKDAHGVGSATSYAKRYALSAAVGIVSDDDDGNAAAGVGPAQKAPATAAPADPPKSPDGYEDWLVEYSKAANGGLPALRKAWEAARKDHRAYLTRHDGDRYNAIRARAEKVAA